ncbi:MAG: type II toxin-antitoxin system RelB/DinJ family antitoxin [Candidatus Adiutrix sp.]|jgi:DNA-damage-inducible protein J|nr:type II toxin-antitoxin system RelB/DinJ family antitoxin [Candidatus Adiutrix sp.]
MAQINIRIDDALKEKADHLFNELGLNMTTAFNMFLKTTIRHQGIPFALSLDPFYSASNMKILKESIRAAEEGQLTAHELIED